ncbi:MAG TPA: DUF302 domain-containing protein [Gammaproteobacteria bacterium]|nr:DUF302 domain-containing protein [Gammaproteobacteria bacterium]
MRTARPFTVCLWALSLAAGLWVSGPARADQLLMARSMQAFPEAMLALQESLTHHGYTVSRVQRVDIGLKKMGFKTDKYRVVFFGKPKQVDELASRYPDLIPYLPLKIAIFAEGDNALLVTSSPLQLASFFHHPELKPVFEQWNHDIQAVLDDLRTSD